MSDIKIDDNCLFEVERRLNVYLNSNKSEELENQHAEKLSLITSKIAPEREQAEDVCAYGIINNLMLLLLAQEKNKVFRSVSGGIDDGHGKIG
ncbi:hypothetical protein TNCV_2740261 [Trichonephila clavipes]|nr:hypothetical protein TNCV_2740261 [Trichonephila clavipes]